VIKSCGATSLTPTVSAIVVLDSDGGRIAGKYYSKEFSDFKTQSAFEKRLYQKTSRSSARVDADVVLFENYIVVYKFISDAYFYVLGPQEENELILLSVLSALEEVMATLLRSQVSKKILIDNYDLLLLALDEIVDDGLVLENDPALITQRVTMKGADKEVPLSE